MASLAQTIEAAQNVARNCEDVARVLRSLSHPVRLKILGRLAEGPCRVGELTERCGTSQSAMSQFLKRMKAEGLVASRRDGHSVFYRIEDPKLHRLMTAISQIYC